MKKGGPVRYQAPLTCKSFDCSEFGAVTGT
jgi:hypothetical protein